MAADASSRFIRLSEVKSSSRASGNSSSASSARRSTPGPAGDELVDRAAILAGMRRRLGVAAVMADQGAAKAMLDQPGRALRAFDAVAAGAAERERRVAAAIEEQQRLLAGGQRLLHRLDDRRRQPAAARRRRRLRSTGRQRRQLLAAVACRQVQRAVAARGDVDDALERRRGRGEHDRRRDQPRAHHAPCRAHCR